MKRFSALFLTVCILLSTLVFTSCGKADSGNKNDSDDKKSGSVYKVVSEAIENTLNAKSYETNAKVSTTSKIMGMVSMYAVEANVKATDLDTSAPKIYVDSEYVSSGYAGENDTYFDGEWKYFDIREWGGYKYRCTLEEFATETGVPQTVIVTLPESLFKKANSVNNADGSLTVTIALDEATIESLYESIVVSVVYAVVGEDLSQTETYDASIEITVADGYVSKYVLKFVSQHTVGSDSANYEYECAMDFVSCDKEVTVTPPANLDQFYEADWG